MATDTETKREVMELPVTPTPTFNQVLQQVTEYSRGRYIFADCSEAKKSKALNKKIINSTTIFAIVSSAALINAILDS